MILVDDFTRMMRVAFLKEKLEAFEKFKIFKNIVENEARVKIKSLRFDRGREFNIYCEVHGIRRQLSSPYSLEQNGTVERRNRSIVEVARAMLVENDVQKTLWIEAVNTTIYTLNIVQIRKGMEKTPYELWFGHSPSIKYFKIFGRKCYIKRE